MSTNTIGWILICIGAIWLVSASEYKERKLTSDDLGGYEVGAAPMSMGTPSSPSGGTVQGTGAAATQSAKDLQRSNGYKQFMEWCKVKDYRWSDYRPDYISIELPASVRDGNAAAAEASKKYYELSGEIMKIRALPATGAVCSAKWIPDKLPSR